MFLQFIFDQNTGNLWVATRNFVHYSHSREGNWITIQRSDWGLPQNSQIYRMGSSKDYIWIQLGSSFVKLDHISGIFLGTFPIPNEKAINWSLSSATSNFSTEIINEYSLTGGWLLVGNSYVNPYGSNGRITVFFIGREGDVILGTDDGTIFIGDNRMKLLDPLQAGLGNSDVEFISGEKNIYLGGRLSNLTKGLTIYDPQRNYFEINDFQDRINLSRGSYFCSLEINDERWYGGNNMIAVYNKKDDYWRMLDESRGFFGRKITDLVADSQFVWIASSSGLFQMSSKEKRVETVGFEKIFNNRYIYDIALVDNLLWIASDYHLTIVDLLTEKLMNFQDIGFLGDMEGKESLLSGFRVIKVYKNEIMVSSNQGVWCFNIVTKKWSELVDPSVFAGREIYAIARNEQYIFMATNDGFIRYDLKDRFIHDYDYEFIGIIHDLVIDNNTLLLGTSNGLIKFKWTKD